MTLSFYSLVMALLWFSLFILLSDLLQRKAGFVLCYRLAPLLFLLGLTVFRLVVPVELPFAQVIRSDGFYPAVQDLLNTPLITIGSLALPLISLLLVLWASGTVFLCIRLFMRIRRDIRRLNRLSALPCPEESRCLEQLLARRGSARRVKLILSRDVPTPMLTGFLKPVILLPAECADLSEDELECILNHELTHLFGHDLWVKLVIQLLCCLMWWNPCVYLLRRDLDSALEYKCDLTVTKAMGDGDKLLYLQTLLNVLKQTEDKGLQANKGPLLQAGFCGIPETATLTRRFQLVLDKPDHYARPAALVFMAAVLVLFAASYSVIIQPNSEPPANDLENQVFIMPETTYILKTLDGTYYVVYDDETTGKISDETLQQEPFCSLPIKSETEVDYFEEKNTIYSDG